jgi:hypothetical protein
VIRDRGLDDARRRSADERITNGEVHATITIIPSLSIGHLPSVFCLPLIFNRPSSVGPPSPFVSYYRSTFPQSFVFRIPSAVNRTSSATQHQGPLMGYDHLDQALARMNDGERPGPRVDDNTSSSIERFFQELEAGTI